ncbi:MAG: aldo/keto reductase [Alphaproteobacteria bacterium]|nr:MAG: aldo/keto reductase [Alphaproteobacteria bacterium]
MRYRPLGTSGLMVSAICLGGNSWGAAGRRAWGAFGPEESRVFFKAALDAGINFFDTADTYNAGMSESIIGAELLSMVSRDEVVIGTKVGIAIADRPNHGGIGRKHILASIDRQLKRLRTDYIDLYQLHRIDDVTPTEEVLATLTDLVRAGKVRHLGASTMPAWRFADLAATARAKGLEPFISMQNLYNLIAREEEQEMIPACRHYGVGLIPYSPLARGFLAGNRDPQGGATERARTDLIARRQEYSAVDWATAAAVVEAAAAYGCSPVQIALAWLFSKPQVVAPVMGATRPEQIAEAAGAVALTLDDATIAALESPRAQAS